MTRAFVLGAGLGERLRPLTEQLPKPLVPVLHRPLLTWAFQHLRSQLGVQHFVVNSWHLAEAYERHFPEHQWDGCPIQVRRDAPILLDTAGGMANVRDLLDDGSGQSFAVYNGDVLSDIDLTALRAEHEAKGNLVTLALRSSGPALHVGFDATSGRVTDIRNKLGTGNDGTHLFTGIYLVSPQFLAHLTPGVKESVVAVFLRLIEAGKKVGALVLDEGSWWDLGNRQSYLSTHAEIAADPLLFPRYESPAQRFRGNPIHRTAQVDPAALVGGDCFIGEQAVVEAGANLQHCVLWPGAVVKAGVTLRGCIVRSGITVTENGEGRDY
jgi:mannose-1-phosphate guanylyltransferase